MKTDSGHDVGQCFILGILVTLVSKLKSRKHDLTGTSMRWGKEHNLKAELSRNM